VDGAGRGFATGVASGESLLVVAGRHWSEAAEGSVAAVWTSLDGRSWTLADLPSDPSASSSDFPTAAAAGRDGFVIGGTVGESEGAVAWGSDDGNDWTRRVVDGDSGVLGVTAGGSGFVMVGVFGRHTVVGGGRPAIWRSSDGVTWARVGPGSEGGLFGELGGVTTMRSGHIAYGRVTEVAVPDVLGPGPYPQLRDAGVPWISPDGKRWTRVDDAAVFAWAQVLEMVAVDSGVLAFGQIRSTEDDSLTTAGWRSADGVRWSRFEPDAPFGVSTASFVAIGGDDVLALATRSSYVEAWITSDGQAWAKLDEPLIDAAEINSAVTFGPDIVAVGDAGSAPTPAGPTDCARAPIWLHAADTLGQ
ncbi:MAG: hypothetical protein OEW29_15030, partial [Acidimicrobiia bacterium]|nr:hypothetical protein [Acidimicrobiia bacterium]